MYLYNTILCINDKKKKKIICDFKQTNCKLPDGMTFQGLIAFEI